jgi:hypothetical protein
MSKHYIIRQTLSAIVSADSEEQARKLGEEMWFPEEEGEIKIEEVKDDR